MMRTVAGWIVIGIKHPIAWVVFPFMVWWSCVAFGIEETLVILSVLAVSISQVVMFATDEVGKRTECAVVNLVKVNPDLPDTIEELQADKDAK